MKEDKNIDFNNSINQNDSEIECKNHDFENASDFSLPNNIGSAKSDLCDSKDDLLDKSLNSNMVDNDAITEDCIATATNTISNEDNNKSSDGILIDNNDNIEKIKNKDDKDNASFIETNKLYDTKNNVLTDKRVAISEDNNGEVDKSTTSNSEIKDGLISTSAISTEFDETEKSDNKTKKSFKHILRDMGELILTFMKLGAMTFGGGYAMISLIQREVVDNKHWMTEQEMLDILAVAESTPGPISINTATYIGTKRCGIFGAIAATFGAVLPSFVIIMIISTFIMQFKDNVWVSYAFMGVRAAVIVLILNAVFKFFKKLEKTIFAIVIMLVTFAVGYFTDFDVIYLLLIAAACGIIYGFVRNYLAKRGAK